MRIIGIIPARMGSSRFPGKPLKPILGIPMLGHVYFRSKMSKLLTEVYIATYDYEKDIIDYATSIKANIATASTAYERPSSICAEVLQNIEVEIRKKADIAVMIQGDEPMVTPEMIDAAIRPLLDDNSVQVTNLMTPLKSAKEHDDKNEPKVVVDQFNNALYFSREPIPSRWRLGEKVPMYKQVCVIPYRRDFLLKFNELESTPLEIAESIDMMRIIEHGFKVRMVLSPTENTYSVDTPQDLAHVEQMMVSDTLIRQYVRD